MKITTMTIIVLIICSLYLFGTQEGRCIIKGGEPIDEIVSYEPCSNPIECKDHISRKTQCYIEGDKG